MPPVSNQEWNQFIDLNQISDTRVLLIAYKIQNSQPLEAEELAMYQAHASRIELQLLQIINRLRNSKP